MKYFKIKTLGFLVFLLVFALRIPAFATVANPNSPPTGNTIENCNLSFHINSTLKDGSSFSGRIAVSLKDIATDKEYSFLLNSSNGFGSKEAYSIIANTTYKITAVCKDQDNYIVLNSNNTKIDSYAATVDGLALNWIILDKESALTVLTSKSDDSLTSLPGASSDMLNKFAEATKFMAKEPKYDTFLRNWSSELKKQDFLTIKGNTEDKWNAMSKYEKACYILICTEPKMSLLGANSSIYAKDRNAFIAGLDIAKMPLDNLPKGNVVYSALVDAWSWHWSNWESQHVFINPFEGNTFNKADREQATTSSKAKPDGASSTDAKAVRNQLASKSTLFKLLKDNALSFVILFIIGGSLLWYLKNNRSKNIDL